MIELPLNIDFSGKVVVVTGAGGVLCQAMVKAFAKAGAKVAALDLNEEAVKTVAEECKAQGYICEGYKVNVLEMKSLEAAHAQILEDFGPCDILVNGAGDGLAGLKGDQGTLLPVQVFAKDMAERKKGSILNISSMNAYIPLTKILAYSGAKAAISNLTQWLATHFAGTGIRCNAIAPGFLVSNQNRTLLFQEDGTPTARSNKILNSTPMRRFVESEELLGSVFFLCDDKAASAVTGVILPIDAGFAAYSGV